MKDRANDNNTNDNDDDNNNNDDDNRVHACREGKTKHKITGYLQSDVPLRLFEANDRDRFVVSLRLARGDVSVSVLRVSRKNTGP